MACLAVAPEIGTEFVYSPKSMDSGLVVVKFDIRIGELKSRSMERLISNALVLTNLMTLNHSCIAEKH